MALQNTDENAVIEPNFIFVLYINTKQLLIFNNFVRMKIMSVENDAVMVYPLFDREPKLFLSYTVFHFSS